MVKLYNEDGSLIGYVEKDYAENFCLENSACWFEKSTDCILTKQDINVIMSMLDDIDDFCGLKPEEFELEEKILTFK